MELAGKVALVTGGSSGIGRAVVEGLLAAGASVAVLDRRAMESAEAQDGRFKALQCDLQCDDQIEGAFASVVNAFGRCDILVNSAGVNIGGHSILEADTSEWDVAFSVNLYAPMLLTKHFAAHVVSRGGGGRIVNVSSSSAFRAGNSSLPYACSKAALGHLTRAVAAELGHYDVNVNAVAPGPTATDMIASFGDASKLDKLVSKGPLENFFHRISEPEDVARVIVFLCLPASRQITGQVIHTSAGAVS